MIVCSECGEELEIERFADTEEKVYVVPHDCEEQTYDCDYCGDTFDSEAAMYGHQTTCEARKNDE